jgi:hypothetical protein
MGHLGSVACAERLNLTRVEAKIPAQRPELEIQDPAEGIAKGKDAEIVGAHPLKTQSRSSGVLSGDAALDQEFLPEFKVQVQHFWDNLPEVLLCGTTGTSIWG